MDGKTEQKYSVRTFEDGDEVAIVKLFEKAYMNYGGFTIKTPECWRWCCLQRPGVEKEGILLALDKESNKIVGYVVAGKSGNLWELSCDPENDRKAIVKFLLCEATAYLESVGASSVNFTAPQSDPIIKQVCKECGFAASPPPKMFLSVLNPQMIVNLQASDIANKLRAKFDEAILLRIKDAPFWINDTISIHINRDGVTVEDAPRARTTIQLQIDYITFSSMLFGNISPFGAFIRSRLKIRPLSKISTALKLLSYLQIGAEWSFPLSDYG